MKAALLVLVLIIVAFLNIFIIPVVVFGILSLFGITVSFWKIVLCYLLTERIVRFFE